MNIPDFQAPPASLLAKREVNEEHLKSLVISSENQEVPLFSKSLFLNPLATHILLTETAFSHFFIFD